MRGPWYGRRPVILSALCIGLILVVAGAYLTASSLWWLLLALAGAGLFVIALFAFALSFWSP